MDGRRLRTAELLLLALAVSACGSEDGQGCVDASGAWTLRSVDQTGTGITCDAPGFTWTISQAGCDLTIAAPPGDPANGAVGVVAGSRLQVEWSWIQGCLRTDAYVSATIDGGTMRGTYGLLQWHPVLPIPPSCPAGGHCSGALDGARQAP
jgi:hypothetical protein